MSFPGWCQLEHVVEGLSSPKNSMRLEVYTIDVTVASPAKLRELAFKFVEDGFKVNLHSTQRFTAVRGKNDNEVVNVSLRKS